jgi:hypothetical protein
MKNTFLLIFVTVVLIISIGCNIQNNKQIKDQRIELPITRKYSGFKLQAIYKGTFFKSEDSELKRENYDLIEINLINDTDSTIEFVTNTIGPSVNIVFDKKGYSYLIPHFISSSEIGAKIESGQIYSFPITIHQNILFDTDDQGPLRVGFMMMTWDMRFKDTRHSNELFDIWRKTHEHVI